MARDGTTCQRSRSTRAVRYNGRVLGNRAFSSIGLVMALSACGAPAQEPVPSTVGTWFPPFHPDPAAVASAMKDFVGPLATERALHCRFTVAADATWQDAGAVTSGTHSGQTVVVELVAIDRIARTVQVQSPDTHGALELYGGDSVMLVEATPAGNVVLVVAPFKAANGEYTASRVRAGPTSVSQFGTCASR